MKSKWYNMQTSGNGEALDVFLYDVIGWETTAAQFIVELNQHKDLKNINVHVNSPGGDVFDGIAIYNTLNQHKAEVTVYVEGLAASIASVIAMAGKKTIMYESSMMMLHKPWLMTIGNSDDLKKDADTLDKIQEAIVKAYLSKAKNLSEKDINELVDEETWLTADDAITYGLADEIDKDGKAATDLQGKQMLAQFKNVPLKIAALARMEVPSAVQNKETSNPKPKEQVMNEEEKKALEAKLAQEKKDAVEAASKAERVRILNIKASGEKLGVDVAIINAAIESGASEGDACKTFIDAMKPGQQPLPGGSIGVNKDEADKFRSISAESLLAVSNITKDHAKKVEALSSGAPKSLHSLMRVCLDRAGVKNTNSMEPANLVGAILNMDQGTGDFSSILATTVNKSFAAGQDQANSTYPIWTKDVPVKDFRQASRVKLSSFADIEDILEGEKPQSGSFSDKKETGTLKTGGRSYTISRQALINDDLGAFTDFISKMGVALENAVERQCYDMLYAGGTPGSGAVGPLMTETSRRLFNATDGNFTDSGAVVSATTLDVGIQAMMTRPRAKGNAKDTDMPTGLIPKYLIISPTQRATCTVLTSSMTYPVATYPGGMPNPYGPGGASALQLVCAPYLYGKDSGYPWYLAANQNEVDTLIRLTLTGSSSPTIEQEKNRAGEALGITYMIYFDWAWMVGDWRGLYKNDGH